MAVIEVLTDERAGPHTGMAGDILIRRGLVADRIPKNLFPDLLAALLSDAPTVQVTHGDFGLVVALVDHVELDKGLVEPGTYKLVKHPDA